MSSLRFQFLSLVLIGLTATACRADEEDESPEARRLTAHLRFVHDAYTGDRFETRRLAYRKLLRERDTEEWQERVNAAKDEKRRKNFLAEYFAYSEDYRVEPIGGFDDAPVRTMKHRLMILMFRPGTPIDGEPVPEKLRNTVYLIIRKEVPFGDENPYGIMLSKAYRGFTSKQLQDVVEAYRKQW